MARCYKYDIFQHGSVDKRLFKFNLISSHGILLRPFSSSGFVLFLVSFVNLSDLRYQRIVWISIRKKRTDGQQNLWNGQGWRPLLLENVKADGAIGVDVWMVDSCSKRDLRRLERVVSWKMNVHEVHASFIWRVIRTHDGCLPVVWVLVVDWACGTVCWWVFSKIDQLFLDSLNGGHFTEFSVI